MPTNFYPSLSTLIPVENIPDDFGVLKNGITQIFDHLYYRDLQISKSTSGDAAFYGLSLVSYKRLAFEIPGTDGMALVLNPQLSDPNTNNDTSEFPISVGYKWGIFKFSKAFEDIANFDFSANSFYNLILDISAAGNVDLLVQAITIFIDDPDPVQKFVDDFNTNHNPPTPLVVNSNPDETVVVQDLLVQMTSNGNNFEVQTVIYDDYLNVDIETVLDNIEALFSQWLGSFTIDDIKTLLIPQASAALTDLNVALVFPASVLRQVDANNVPLQDSSGNDVPGEVTVDLGSILYSTGNGLELNIASPTPNINFTPSEILKSGFILSVTDMNIDLSRTKNIPEATADGRPDDFMGVFIKDGSIDFPAYWNHDKNGSTGELKVHDLLAGTGGLSGTIALEAKSAGDPSPFIKANLGGGFDVSLDAFSLTFEQNSIVDSEITGSLTIPGFKDAQNTSNPATIDIDVHIGNNGAFDVTASIASPLKVSIPKVLDFNISSVEIGKDSSGEFFIAASGSIDFTADVPGLGGVLPKGIDIKKIIIHQNGTIELEGGTIVLPKAATLKVGPAKLSVTALGFGSYEREHGGTLRKYKYVEFSAGISVNPGGVDARGDGIKVYFTVDGGPLDIFVRIAGIGIDLVIPGNASKETAALLLDGNEYELARAA